MVMSMYLSVIARVLLISSDAFSEAIMNASQLIRDTHQSVLNTILDVWISKMPCVSQPEKRKLLGEFRIRL